MKRDMDLVRIILKELEDLPDDGRCFDLDIPDHPKGEVYAHVRLMHEAGLIEAVDFTTHDGMVWKPKRLTWVGDEFLEAYRNDTFWQKGKELVLKAGGGLTLEGLKLVIPAILKSYIRVEG